MISHTGSAFPLTELLMVKFASKLGFSWIVITPEVLSPEPPVSRVSSASS